MYLFDSVQHCHAEVKADEVFNLYWKNIVRKGGTFLILSSPRVSMKREAGIDVWLIGIL